MSVDTTIIFLLISATIIGLLHTKFRKKTPKDARIIGKCGHRIYTFEALSSWRPLLFFGLPAVTYYMQLLFLNHPY